MIRQRPSVDRRRAPFRSLAAATLATALVALAVPPPAAAQFEVPGNASFDIEVDEALHYVCHFGRA